MAEPRRGRQTPTKSVTLPYTETHGQAAIDLYNFTFLWLFGCFCAWIKCTNRTQKKLQHSKRI